MATILGLFGKGEKAEEKAVNAVLTRLHREKTPVRMEIERSKIRFTSMLAFKNNSVLAAKPEALNPVLKSGHFVRFKVPWEPEKTLRMAVTTTNFNLTNGNPVFICQPPTTFAESAHRVSERFNTMRYSTMLLRFHDLAGEFRIVDISGHGCRFQASEGGLQKTMPIGKTIPGAWIQLGNKATIELETVTPKIHQKNEVGVEFVVKADGKNRKILDHLISSLDKQQKENIRASSF